jgi:hypothetical protein
VLALVVALPLVASAEPVDGASDHGQSWGLYQRKGHLAGPWYGDWNRGGFRYMPQQVASGWFQRPYPYHLDYYRMRYGGSYAPYFGNLYGPPNVLYYPPPYYGDYSQFYGGYGYPPSGYPGYGYSQNGYPGGPPCNGPYCSGPGGYPAGPGYGQNNGDAASASASEADATATPPVVP